VVDDIYGFYLDSTWGFHANRKAMIEHQKKVGPALPGTDLDARSLSYALRDGAEARVRHRSTQGEFKRRNEQDGDNCRRLVQMVLVVLYEHWESHHREQIARAMGLESKKQLVSPLFGDLRLLRHVVIHRRGIMDDDTAGRLCVIGRLHGGDPVFFTDENFETLFAKLYETLDLLIVDAGFADPEHRMRWKDEVIPS
jgi:hypothetical protein